MSTLITKRHNSYRAIEGAVLGWERGKIGEGHKVQVIEPDNTITSFKWRAPKDPVAGDQVTVVLPETGVSAKPDRAIMILNQTTGETHREVNAHDPNGARSIMVNLVIWDHRALAAYECGFYVRTPALAPATAQDVTFGRNVYMVVVVIGHAPAAECDRLHAGS